MKDLQHFPTPLALAKRAWAKFQNKTIARLLEPSAGKGDLMLPQLDDRYHRTAWDAIETDVLHHPLLRQRGATVVGYDFLAHTSCSIYSHILMNPPFAQGARHLLHAWNTLFEGEIVAIINAETLRNPYSQERQHLVRLVEAHGSVEFIESAFLGDEVERETSVEVALVYLKKKADSSDIIGDILEQLRKEKPDAAHLDFRMPLELTLPEGFVEATVRNFDAASLAAREAAVAQVRAQHYASRLGKTMEMLQAEAQGEPAGATGVTTRDAFAAAYELLKNAAWTQILRSTEVLERMSSAARKRAEAEFGNIRSLEFTVPNVYGFLQGLCESASAIQAEMACDVFDCVTRYREDNAVYYMGWKSNDKHRTAGMRIKRTRFILAGHSCETWQKSASYETQRLLSDFDLVFAMLDGKSKPENGLVSLFTSTESFKRLCQGERLTSEYFEVRFYPQRGTIHFFPTNMEVVERLNRFVGKRRQWLPPVMTDASKDFEKQYEQAEKHHAEVLKAFAATGATGWRGSDSTHGLSSKDEDERAAAHERLSSALESVLSGHGVHPFAHLEQSAPRQLMLAND